MGKHTKKMLCCQAPEGEDKPPKKPSAKERQRKSGGRIKEFMHDKNQFMNLKEKGRIYLAVWWDRPVLRPFNSGVFCNHDSELALGSRPSSESLPAEPA